MAEQISNSGKSWPIFLAASAFLIGNFLWRFFVPAHEFPVRSEQILDMALDTLLLIGVVGARMGASFFRDDNKRVLANTIFCFALAAGIGLFLIRFSSNEAWWTGHRLYWLPPRTGG